LSDYFGEGIAAETDLITTPYYNDGSSRSPRYYQTIAINRTIEAVSKNQQRILLVMATGTGKTRVAVESFIH
jgi:type I restriction enzyme R subunit